MKKILQNLLLMLGILLFTPNVWGQNKSSSISKRSASNPTQCASDTVTFPSYSASAYNLINANSTLSFGQYYDAPQDITISGYRFYAVLPYDTTTGRITGHVTCSIYEAGQDSLPTGNPLRSKSVQIDTVQGTLFLNRMEHDVVFDSAITMNKGYVLVLSVDTAGYNISTVSNSWANGDGELRNLSCAYLNGKWYRGLSLNVSGTPFDCHMQFYPFVSYKFATDFNVTSDCYVLLDTLQFQNLSSNSVVGSIFYNSYMYYASSGFDDFCHDWQYNGNINQLNSVDGAFKPATKSNVNVSLRSFLVQYTSSQVYCYDTTDKVNFFKPSTPGLTQTPLGCIGDSLQMTSSSAAGDTLEWYSQTNSSIPFFKGNSYTIQNVQNPDTFVLKAVNGSCVSSRDYIAYVSASNYPSQITVTNDSVCTNANANLSASPDYGTAIWYSSPSGGNPVFIGNNYQTSALSADTTLYVTAMNNGCSYQSARVMVQAFVGSSFAPSAPTGVSDTTICYNGQTTNIDLSASTSSAATIRWFDVDNGGTPLGTGNTYQASIDSRGEKTYYVETWDGNCGSGRISVKIIASEAPATFAKLSDEICFGDSADIAASTLWGGVKWFSDKSSTSPYYTGKFNRVGGLQSNPTYAYFKTYDGNCLNDNFDSVEIIVNIPPTAKNINAPAVCFKTPGAINLDLDYGQINWFEDETTNTSFASGTSLDLGLIFASKTVFYETVQNGCTSDRMSITVNSLDRPSAGFQWELLWQRRVVCTPINTNNMTIEWDLGDGNTTTGNSADHTYDQAGEYTITMVGTHTTTGCKDTAIVPVNVSHNKTNNVVESVGIFPNPVNKGQIVRVMGGENATWIKVIDVQGRTVQYLPSPKNNYIHTSTLAVGVYIIQTQNKQGQINSGKLEVIN